MPLFLYSIMYIVYDLRSKMVMIFTRLVVHVSIGRNLSEFLSQFCEFTGEWEDGRSHLKSTRQSLEDLEQSKQLLSEELSHKQKALAQSQAENSKLKENVEKLRSLLEDQQEENTELISKITTQSAEISSVKNANVELQSKLGMAELLVQQVH